MPEPGDIIEAANFDSNEIDANPELYRVLLRELRTMRLAIQDGSYQFGRQDWLPMCVVKQHAESDLPCMWMLYDINQTHRPGLDIDTD